MGNVTDTNDKFKFGVHPQYTEHSDDWQAMDDAYEGEERVKSRGVKYLPATVSQELDGMLHGQKGYKAYDAYKKRAVFPDYVTDAVETLVGMLHAKPGKITVPEKYAELVTSITKSGENCLAVLRRVNELQLSPGRVGLLVDVDLETRKPYLSLYLCTDIVNWDGTRGVLEYVVLDESYSQLDKASGKWVDVARHRICDIKNGLYRSAIFENGETYDESNFKEIRLNGKALGHLPMPIINARAVSPDCDRAPLLGLARACYSIYRLEADYRQNLHMQGQDTLVIKDVAGGESGAPVRVGAGACVEVGIGGDAKYIGIDGRGLPEQRMALENDKQHAKQRAGHFIASGKASQESGDALRTRLAALTATLTTIAQAGAQGLEKALKSCVEFMGGTADEIAQVKVEPNTEFFDIQVLGQDLELFMRSISEGAPLSPESVHSMLKQRGIAKFDYETEVAKRDEQYKPVVAPKPAVPQGGGNQNQA